MTMRYVYLGDRLTDPALVGQPCDPVRRARDGKCIRGRGNQLVVFADGVERVVLARRLRVVNPTPTEDRTPTGDA